MHIIRIYVHLKISLTDLTLNITLNKNIPYSGNVITSVHTK
jgi:hypothetical protein